MAKKVRIALDAMGGDFGPSVVVPGGARTGPSSGHVLCSSARDADQKAARASETRGGIGSPSYDRRRKNDDKPSQALRSGRRGSSMWLAIEAVKKGEADVAVSAGNTGALMAMSRIGLRLLPGIERPAIAAIWPTVRGESVVLDVGATIGGDAEHRRPGDHGQAMARVLFDLDRPTVGLLKSAPRRSRAARKSEAAEAAAQAGLPELELSGIRRGRRHRQGRGPT